MTTTHLRSPLIPFDDDNEPVDDDSDEFGGVKKAAPLCLLLRQVFGYLTYKDITSCLSLVVRELYKDFKHDFLMKFNRR